jgi:glycosyltransferase involved in cell wall biosynthesis
VFVVDSFSTDGTREVVERLGCRVVTRPFTHYADQRNWAIQEVANDWPWQLHLDADEVLDERAIVAIRDALSTPGTYDGFLIKRLSYFMGKPLRFAGEKSWHLRLFRSTRAACEDRLYDQHFTCLGPTRKLAGLLHDLNAGTLTEWTARHNRWSDLESAEMLRPSTRVGLLESKLSSDPRKRRRYYKGIYYRMPRGWRALGYFVYRYVLQLGFLDGRAGFYYNFLQSLWFRMLVDAKLAEAAGVEEALALAPKAESTLRSTQNGQGC